VRALIAWLLLAVAACQPAATARDAAEETAPAAGSVSVYVVSNGWHTGIVLERTEVSAVAIPEIADFPEARYFEFGWGDAAYYPAPQNRLGVGARALLTPTPAVVHLAGLPAHPRRVFPQAETVEVSLSPRGLRALLDYLGGAFDRNGGERVEPSAPGLYRFSRFYPGTGRFHLFNTCNTWTARGLAEAGLPVTVAGILRAEDLMAQLRPQ